MTQPTQPEQTDKYESVSFEYNRYSVKSLSALNRSDPEEDVSTDKLKSKILLHQKICKMYRLTFIRIKNCGRLILGRGRMRFAMIAQGMRFP